MRISHFPFLTEQPVITHLGFRPVPGPAQKSNSFLGHHELKVVKAGRGDNCGDYLSCFAMHFVAAGSILLSLL